MLCWFCALIPTSYAYDIRGLPSITVLAPSSMIRPLTEIVRLYSEENNITVTASFDNSSEQARKITDGEAANVFISSSDLWLNQLKQLGVLNVNSVTTLMENKLVLVASPKHPMASTYEKNTSINEIMNDIITQKLPVTSFVIGNPDITALGMYSKQVLSNLGYWYQIESILVASASSSKTLYTIIKSDNVSIADGENLGVTGITYKSDALNNPHIRIISEIDPELHDPVIYWAAVVIDDQMDNAIDFLNFMKGDRAAVILKKYGFYIK